MINDAHLGLDFFVFLCKNKEMVDFAVGDWHGEASESQS